MSEERDFPAYRRPNIGFKVDPNNPFPAIPPGQQEALQVLPPMATILAKAEADVEAKKVQEAEALEIQRRQEEWRLYQAEQTKLRIERQKYNLANLQAEIEEKKAKLNQVRWNVLLTAGLIGVGGFVSSDVLRVFGGLFEGVVAHPSTTQQATQPPHQRRKRRFRRKATATKTASQRMKKLLATKRSRKNT